MVTTLFRNKTNDPTLRNLQVLILMSNGRTNKKIAAALGISEKTVKAHVTQVFHLMTVTNRTQAALLAVETIKRWFGIVSMHEDEYIYSLDLIRQTPILALDATKLPLFMKKGPRRGHPLNKSPAVSYFELEQSRSERLRASVEDPLEHEMTLPQAINGG